MCSGRRPCALSRGWAGATFVPAVQAGSNVSAFIMPARRSRREGWLLCGLQPPRAARSAIFAIDGIPCFPTGAPDGSARTEKCPHAPPRVTNLGTWGRRSPRRRQSHRPSGWRGAALLDVRRTRVATRGSRQRCAPRAPWLSYRAARCARGVPRSSPHPHVTPLASVPGAFLFHKRGVGSGTPADSKKN